MQLGLIGLGRMGGNMVHRLQQGGHAVVAYDRSQDAVRQTTEYGATGASSIAELCQQLSAPRAVWVMTPSGAITEQVIDEVASHMQAGDIMIDGGNSNFHDSQARAKRLAEKDIKWLDAGTSGGVWGLKVGYCLMIGGDEDAYAYCEPIFKTLAPPDGYAYMGPAGSGHYVKMVHNGIEYGMLQAYGEGFEILKNSDFPELDLHKISHLWNQGSVVRSWLLELAELAFADDPDLHDIRGWVEDSGEGRWTVLDAIEHSVPAPVLTLSLLARFSSRQDESFSAKVIAALRNQFGGHAVKKQ